MNQRLAKIASMQCGQGQPLTLIGGPCVLEDQSSDLRIATRLQQVCHERGISFVYKASFDKANRTSIDAYRGPGLKRGLEILAAIRQQLGVPVTTDIHLPDQAAPVGEVCDLVQIPAFLARQTDLLIAAARTGKAVNVKKGQFMAPHEMQYVVEKLQWAGCEQILLTERGTFFGYGRLINDFTAIPQMQSFGVPVIFDATHSVQLPAGMGHATGGNRQMVGPLAKAAVAIGCDGIFLETHPDPSQSPSDGPNMIPLFQLPELLDRLILLHGAANNTLEREL